ncbi:hypothetical protein M0R72_15150 [Candidatus Pacearchaeota archaeon]|jgi:hypothetical protein|nr:hypothetical protein [Candidatus Pacearchaeota archaeon]
MPELELTLFSEGEWVIIGDHLSLEEALEYAKKEDPEHALSFTEVKHYWVRYEFAEGDEREEFQIESWWRLHETTKRPKGITKKATVLS